MMTKIFLALIILFSLKANSCEVTSPENLLLFDENPKLEDIISAENCRPEEKKEFIQTLVSVDGKISGFQLKEILKNKHFHILVKNEFIEIQHLKNLIRESLSVPANHLLSSIKSNEEQNFIPLDRFSKIQITCNECRFLSLENLGLVINRPDGTAQSVKIEAQFKKMVKAFKVIGNQQAFTELSKINFVEELVEAIPHTDLFNEKDHLNFYKINKPIGNGNLIRLSDLSAIDLVKAGLKTEVIIENEMIKLKTHGISRSNGSLGQLVEVFHPQKNKKYLGKVVGFNKVTVEL